MTLEQFQTEDMTSKPAKESDVIWRDPNTGNITWKDLRDRNSLTAKMIGRGIEPNGAFITGSVAVIKWDTDKDQEVIRLANLRRQAAQVVAETVGIEAGAEAKRIKEVSFAKNLARAAAVQALSGDVTAAAQVLCAEEQTAALQAATREGSPLLSLGIGVPSQATLPLPPRVTRP